MALWWSGRDVRAKLVASLGMLLAAVAFGVAPDAAWAERGSSRTTNGFTTGYSDAVVEMINERIRQAWTDNEVTPSPAAEDAEWLRRVYLDIVGAIPPADVVESFMKDRNRAKRADVVESLLEDSGYVRNWTTIWTNLCIGRETPRRTSRAGMQKFFREAFARNRPWNEIVFDLVSAEGHFEENGAVNYLLAQMTMNDEGVQATAMTTRLFMGIQVQCTQCHNHPFNDWQQEQFWQFNSFFRQARRVDHRRFDPETGRQVDDYSELVATDFSGPVYFEKRSGLMQVAYPKFFETSVDPGPGTDRREELARLMTQGDEPYLALAAVNRMWAHFFGYGFTRPIDDMGPHNPPSHPDLLDGLADEFIKSGYDLKQLIRWICNSEAYNLTSQFNRGNEVDNPAIGEMPLFSHMYVKSMQAEQLYDSLIIATEAHKTASSSWDEAERQRQEWLQQFVVAFGTDENDEATTFNGTIPQALMMMNGELVRNAIRTEPGSYLHRVLSTEDNDNDRIQRLYLSTLSRLPERREVNAAKQLLSANRDKLAGYQDLFWALLNSNEFIFNH